MEKLFVKRRGPGWHLTADLIYKAYLDSGEKLSIEFESMLGRQIDEFKTIDRQTHFRLKMSNGRLSNENLLCLSEILKKGVEYLACYMSELAYNEDCYARYMYLISKNRKISKDELQKKYMLVHYLRDQTLESLARKACLQSEIEVNELNMADMISRLRKEGYEETTIGINKGVYYYKRH